MVLFTYLLTYLLTVGRCFVEIFFCSILMCFWFTHLLTLFLFSLCSCTLLLLQQRADVSANIFIVPEPEEIKEDTKKSSNERSNNEEEEKESIDNGDEDEDEDEEGEDHDDDDEDTVDKVEEYKSSEKMVKNKPVWFWDPLRKRKKTQEITSYSVFQVNRRLIFYVLATQYNTLDLLLAVQL